MAAGNPELVQVNDPLDPYNKNEPYEFTAMTFNIGLKKGKNKDKQFKALQKALEIGKFPVIVFLQEVPEKCENFNFEDFQYKYGVMRVKCTSVPSVDDTCVLWRKDVFEMTCMASGDAVEGIPDLQTDRFQGMVLKHIKKGYEILVVSWHGRTKLPFLVPLKNDVEELRSQFMHEDVVKTLTEFCEKLRECSSETVNKEFFQIHQTLENYPRQSENSRRIQTTLFQMESHKYAFPGDRALMLKYIQMIRTHESAMTNLLGTLQTNLTKVKQYVLTRLKNPSNIDSPPGELAKVLSNFADLIENQKVLEKSVTDFESLIEEYKSVQLTALLDFCEAFCGRYLGKTRHILVGGDFNINLQNPPNGYTNVSAYDNFQWCVYKPSARRSKNVDYVMSHKDSTCVVKSLMSLDLVKEDSEVKGWCTYTDSDQRIRYACTEDVTNIMKKCDHDPVYAKIKVTPIPSQSAPAPESDLSEQVSTLQIQD